MKKFRVYFVDNNGYGGDVIWEGKNITDIKGKVKCYVKLWQLAPISDLEITEVKEG